MPNQLSIANAALRALGSRQLAALDEDRATARYIQSAFDGGLIQRCLEAAPWRFAIRTARLGANPSIDPPFGYEHAMEKPEDWVRTVSVCVDEFFNQPTTQYTDETGFIFSAYETIYLQYVSGDPAYGTNFSGWPESFTRYVEYRLAQDIAALTTQSDSKLQMLGQMTEDALRDAKAKDALGMPTRFPPRGAWASARHGYGNASRDRNGNWS